MVNRKLFIVILLFLLGFLLFFTGGFIPFLRGYSVLCSVVLWTSCIVIIGLHLITKRKKRKDSFIESDFSVRIRRVLERGAEKYCSAVSGRRGFFRRSALYDRPLFVVCGSHKSGKTSLLKYSDLTFPMMYPSEEEEVSGTESLQVRWYCSDSAVWIDTPGVCTESSYTEEWTTFCSSLKRIRKRRPVDGLVLVVSLEEVIGSESNAVLELASRLRSVIDSMIVQCGVEFPVYLVYSKTDELAGFSEYFAEQISSDRSLVLGAVLDCSLSAQPAKKQFEDKFREVSALLGDLRTDKLLNTKSSRERETICRFVLEFQCVKDNLSLLVSELFRKSEYGGDPDFRAFFFTGSLKRSNSTIDSLPGDGLGSISTFNTESITAGRNASTAAACRNVFASSLLREVIPKDKPLVRLNLRQRRRRRIMSYAAVAILSLLFLFLSGMVFFSGLKSMTLLNSVKTELGNIPASESAAIGDRLVRLEKLRRMLVLLQEEVDRSFFVDPGGVLFKPDRVIEKIKPVYVNEANRLVISPACKFLEYDIYRMSGYRGEIAGNRYEKLYNSLKVYLSVSQGADRQMSLDTVLSGSLLRESAGRVFNLSGKPQRDESIRSVLDESIGTCLFYLKRGEFPSFPKNEKVVENARQRLNRKPSTKAIYSNLVHRLVSEAPVVTLDQILKRKKGEGVLASDHTISSIFTQNGWEQIVHESFKVAAEDPFRDDWVVGAKKSSFEVDSKGIMNEMTRLYADDFIREWLSFMQNIHFREQTDLTHCRKLLHELSSANSELTQLIAGLCHYTQLRSAGQNGERPGVVAGIEKKFGQSDKLSSALDRISSGREEQFTKVQMMFTSLQPFAEVGIGQYSKATSELERRISALESATDKDMVTAFSSPENDPFRCYALDLKKTLESLPAELSSSLHPLMSEPMEQSASSVSAIFRNSLNSVWKRDIYQPFMEKLQGRYPFSKNGPDASLEDFEEFFRPGTGLLWSFYDSYLAIYLTRTPKGWVATKYDNGFRLEFDNQIGSFLNMSEKISNLFFRSDGTRKQVEIAVHPSASIVNRAEFIFGNEQYQLLPGGNPFVLYWPSRGPVKTAVLRIATGESTYQEIRYQGNWGVMKLFEAAQLQNMSSTVQIAKWQVSMQKLYALQLKARIRTSSESPFSNPVLKELNCPAELFQH